MLMSNYQRKLIISYFTLNNQKIKYKLIMTKNIIICMTFYFKRKEGKNDNYSNCKTNHFANGQLQGKLFTF